MLNKDFLLKNIKRNLLNIEPNLAMQYLLWLDKKTMYFKDSVLKNGYGLQPDDLKRGDIVWVDFGINVGTELSDYATKGHYAIVWAVDLGNVIVVPLPMVLLTFTLSQKLCITANPRPARSSSGAVVNKGSIAFFMSSIPQPLSRILIIILLPSQILPFM